MAFQPPPVTKLELNDDIKNAVNGALESGHPIVIGYVADNGYPHLSFRGSTQVHGPQQLAIWVRNPEGGFPKTIAERPKVSLLYLNHSGTPAFLSFRGQARIDPSANDSVYRNAPKREQEQDPEKRGAAVIIELDSVDGFGASGPFRMEHDAS